MHPLCPLQHHIRNPSRGKSPFWSLEEIFTFFSFLFFYLINYFYLFLAALGLRCCAWAFSSCGERGLLFVAVHGLLIAVASLVAEHEL